MVNVKRTEYMETEPKEMLLLYTIEIEESRMGMVLSSVWITKKEKIRKGEMESLNS
jgi:hypothetical protein